MSTTDLVGRGGHELPFGRLQVVFVHLPTKTLIVTDLFWNYPIDAPAGTRAWKWGMDEVWVVSGVPCRPLLSVVDTLTPPPPRVRGKKKNLCP